MRLSVTADEERLFKVLPPIEGVCIQREPYGITFTCSTDKMCQVKECLAKSLPDIIIENYEKLLLSDIVKSSCKNFSKEQQKKILKHALDFADEISQKNDDIEQKLSEYLKSSDNLVLDGFVNFRLKDYKNSLKNVVDIAVDRYVAENEYDEFISLLKYFIDIQSPGEEVVHIIPLNGEYRILNKNMTDITECCCDIIPSYDITSEDILLSSLITVAPKNIIIHKKIFIPSEFLKTLSLIFTDRIIFCKGCPNCE